MAEFYQRPGGLPPTMLQCAICPSRNTCLRASAMSAVDSDHPERLQEYVVGNVWKRERTETEAMRLGTEAHKEIEEMRGVEKDPVRIVERMRAGERFFLTVSCCSVHYGYRGTPDAVLAEPMGRKLKLTIIDEKTHVSRPYARQLGVYGLIFTDPNMMYTRAYADDAESLERRRFYDDVEFMGKYDDIEVWTQFNIYERCPDGKLKQNMLTPQPFSRGRIFPKEKYFAIQRAKQKILDAIYEPELLASSAQMRFSMVNAELLGPRKR